MSKTLLYPHAQALTFSAEPLRHLTPAPENDEPLSLRHLAVLRPTEHAPSSNLLLGLVPPSEPFQCEPPPPPPAVVAQRIVEVGPDSWRSAPRPAYMAPAQRTKILRPVLTPKGWFEPIERGWTRSG